MNNDLIFRRGLAFSGEHVVVVPVVAPPFAVACPVPWRQQYQRQRQRHRHNYCSFPQNARGTTLFSFTSLQSSSSSSDNEDATPFFDSIVLTQVYPSLLEFQETYGHVNIPLGTSDGRKCETLRRLQVQGKLSDRDVAALNALKFRWHSLEDVYYTANFEDLFQRLVDYIQTNNNNINNKEEGSKGGDDDVLLQLPPKKYDPDPELGAWVTGLRRVGRSGVQPSHAKALDDIGFSWVSQRKCGSAFMKQYREIQQEFQAFQKEQSSSSSSSSTSFSSYLENNVKIQQWIRAQQEAAARGSLSETRMHYMEQLFPDWKEWKQQQQQV